MRFYARQYGEDEEVWGLTGLLHDFDWEIHPSLEGHPQDGAPILRQRGVPELIVRGILGPRGPYRRASPISNGEMPAGLRRDHRSGHRSGAGAPLQVDL